MIAADESLICIDAFVEEALERFQVPGAAVGIVHDDAVILAHGYGFRNLNAALPLNEETLLPIASSSKAMTSFLVATLVDEGKLSWDDPVVKYLPEFRLYSDTLTQNVTIRDLLAHRTGIVRHDVAWFFSDTSNKDILHILQFLAPDYRLREKFQYNNFMYAVAGMIVERVTGQTWEDALFCRVFQPLGMISSHYNRNEFLESGNFSLPYASIDGAIQQLPFHRISALAPCGGVSSNVADMVKWVQFNLKDNITLDENLIRYETFQEMRKSQISVTSSAHKENVASLSGYGLGWFLGSYRGYPLIFHGGDLDGFSSEVTMLPEQKLGLVILMNNSSEGREFCSCLRNKIFDQLLGIETHDWMKVCLENRAKTKQLLQAAQVKTLVSQPIRSLQEYVGVYQHPSYGPICIDICEGSLTAYFKGLTLPLVHKKDDLFEAEFRQLLVFGINPWVDFSFETNSNDEVAGLLVPFEAFRGCRAVVFNKQSNRSQEPTD